MMAWSASGTARAPASTAAATCSGTAIPRARPRTAACSVLAGDDHGAKSSTVPHQSDHAFISALMPYLYPSSIHEMIEMGLLGIAMSRYSGCWVGMKVITETVETTAEIDLTDEMTPFNIPTDFEMPPGGLNLRWPDDRFAQDLRLQDYKGYAAIAFARANNINRITMDSPNARYGIMASGKSYEDIRQALRELGITEEVAAKIGLAALQDRHALAAGAGRRPQVRRRPRRDLHRRGAPRDRREPGQAGAVQLARRRPPAHRRQDGRPRQALLDLRRPSFRVASLASSLTERLLRLNLNPEIAAMLRAKADWFNGRQATQMQAVAPVTRTPYFCSGCPAQHLDQGARGAAAPLPASAATSWRCGWTARPRPTPTWEARACRGSASHPSPRKSTCSPISATALISTPAASRSGRRSPPAPTSPTSCSTTMRPR